MMMLMTWITVDPEMRKEFEESQKSNPMNSIMGGGSGGPNFDVASFLAGSSSSREDTTGGNSASEGGRKGKGGRR